MSFKDMVAADNAGVFLNLNEFAEVHDIRCDGETYAGVSCVITRLKAQDRGAATSDHAQGIYLVSAILHCKLEDIGGVLPEKGGKLYVDDEGFMQRFIVAQAGCDMGMARLELEALDE